MEKIDHGRRNFLKGTGAVLGAAALRVKTAEAQNALTIGETYEENESAVLSKGKELYEQLLTRNPNLRDELKEYTLSLSRVAFGPRSNPSWYGAFAIHRKDASEFGLTSIGRTLPKTDYLDAITPGVLAVIPAEKSMTYERFREFYNHYTNKLRAEK